MTNRIKPLKFNGAGLTAIIMTMIASFLLALFGILNLVNPHTEKMQSLIMGWLVDSGFSQSKTEYWLGMVMHKDKVFIFAPTMFNIAWLPMVYGLTIFTVVTVSMIFNLVGFKVTNKKEIRQIVAPIKSYYVGMIFVWIGVFTIVPIYIMSLYSASPLMDGVAMQITDKKGAFAMHNGMVPIAKDLNPDLKPGDKKHMIYNTWADLAQEAGGYKPFWLVFSYFQSAFFKPNSTTQYMKFNLFGFENFLISIIPMGLILIFELVALCTGEVGWKRVNLLVLANIGDQSALNALNAKRSIGSDIKAPELSIPVFGGDVATQVAIQANENASPMGIATKDEIKERKKIKKDVYNYETVFDAPIDITSDIESTNVNLKSKCLTFFKRVTQMMTDCGNTQNSLYTKFSDTYKQVSENRMDDKLEEVASGITDYIGFATNVDVQFVQLMGRLTKNNPNLYGQQTNKLQDLGTKYLNAIQSWDLYEAEVLISQIFVIAAIKTEVLAKVGYCIKHRLANNYNFIEQRTNGTQKLNVARDSKNYGAYKQSVMQIISMMSPDRQAIATAQQLTI